VTPVTLEVFLMAKQMPSEQFMNHEKTAQLLGNQRSKNAAPDQQILIRGCESTNSRNNY